LLLSALSRIRSILALVAALFLLVAGLMFSSSAQAAGLVIQPSKTSYTVTFPNSPVIDFTISDTAGPVPNNGTITLHNKADGRIFAMTTVVNGKASLQPIDDAWGWLPISATPYTFFANYGDDRSEDITVKVDKGLVDLNFTAVTPTANNTATFSYAISAQGIQTADTQPAGLVILQADGEDVAYQNVPTDDAKSFAGVAFTDGVEYRLSWYGSDEYASALSPPYVKGGTIPTTTTTTAPTTTTTSPTTTTSTTSAPTSSTSTPPTTPSTPTTVRPAGEEPAPQARPQGYRLVDSDGTVRNYGVQGYGDASKLKLNAPMISATATASDNGYWLLGADGGIFNYGDAKFFGSMGGKPLNQPIVGLAPTPTGNGYWLVASDGGVFAYGDAGFYGSMGGQPLNKPVVGITAAADGKGYRMVASDGGIFSFGSANFYGSMGGKTLNKPVVGMTSTPSGDGYWLVASDGGIFAYGNAAFFGSTGNIKLNQPIVAMRSTITGNGYWFVAADGGVFNYGDAPFAGSAAGTGKLSTTVALA
jgi:hypothetical protein